MNKNLLISLSLVTLLIAVIMFTSASSVFAAVEKQQPPFRCFRPFSQLRSFTAKDMSRKDNCEFAPFMRLTNAGATVKCYNKNQNSDDGEQKDGCYVTLNFTAEKFHPQASGNFHPAQFEQFFRERDQKGLHLDSMRYAVELKAVGSSTVRYKGFGNTGYSVCCAMIQKPKILGQEEDENEICEWVELPPSSPSQENSEEHQQITREQRVKSQTACPLNDPSYDPVISQNEEKSGRSKLNVKYDKKIYGEITRPLHRKIFGKWEARIELYKDSVEEGIGRIVIPFELKAEDYPTGNENEFGNEKQQTQEDASASAAVVTVPKEEGQ